MAKPTQKQIQKLVPDDVTHSYTQQDTQLVSRLHPTRGTAIEVSHLVPGTVGTDHGDYTAYCHQICFFPLHSHQNIDLRPNKSKLYKLAYKRNSVPETIAQDVGCVTEAGIEPRHIAVSSHSSPIAKCVHARCVPGIHPEDYNSMAQHRANRFVMGPVMGLTVCSTIVYHLALAALQDR